MRDQEKDATLLAAMTAAEPTSSSTIYYQAKHARFREIKAAMAQWDADCEQARIRSGYAALDDEHSAASAKAGDLVRLAAHNGGENATWRTGKGRPGGLSLRQRLLRPNRGSFAAKKQVSVEDFLFSAARDVAPAVSSGS